MQNKPNLLDAQMNISSSLVKTYENNLCSGLHENKANQSQFPKGQNEIKLLFNKGL